MTGDHVERVEAFLRAVESYGDDEEGNVIASEYNRDGTPDDLGYLPLTRDDLRATLDELTQLRAQQRPALGSAYVAGWTDAIAGVRTPGWAEREAGWKRFLGDADADPEAYAKTKFAADMERLRTADPGGAQWVEHILSERTGLPDRQAKLLVAIQREGGEWAPIRARGVLVQAGYAVTKERAHQIMKQLAERGYLEQVRPRAYTYRLKAETPQQPECGGGANATP